MNNLEHQRMVQAMVKDKFKGVSHLRCKVRPRYPEQAEREYQRVTNAYMRCLSRVLKEYIPTLKNLLIYDIEPEMKLDAKNDKPKDKRIKTIDPKKLFALRVMFDDIPVVAGYY